MTSRQRIVRGNSAASRCLTLQSLVRTPTGRRALLRRRHNRAAAYARTSVKRLRPRRVAHGTFERLNPKWATRIDDAHDSSQHIAHATHEPASVRRSRREDEEQRKPRGGSDHEPECADASPLLEMQPQHEARRRDQDPEHACEIDRDPPRTAALAGVQVEEQRPEPARCYEGPPKALVARL